MSQAHVHPTAFPPSPAHAGLLDGSERARNAFSKKLVRAETILLLTNGVITADEAQALLGLGRSQIYALRASASRNGSQATFFDRVPARPSNALPDSLRARAIDLIRDEYPDYGPTLVTEMLRDSHDIRISRETARQWMIQAGIWVPSGADRRKIYRLRNRMLSYGALIQIDGSDHDWFEDRAERCTAMVYIDDATSRIQILRMYRNEDQHAYLETSLEYICRYGRPIRMQTDKHAAVFSQDGPTIWGKALTELTISHSPANSPQSKGRVERTHRTLQDRLVKAFRREGISSIDAANAYLPAFVAAYNDQFSKEARSAEDVHREVPEHIDLDRTFSSKCKRKLGRQPEFSINNAKFVVEANKRNIGLSGKKIHVEFTLENKMRIFGPDGELRYYAVDV
ncbi:ISNCY family transposase [Sphingobium sp. AP49]|uniref:ISNCY family transposase n=1 Tax=Sphingobium sp. AP49 TaxID=1144307 RepID=UPI00026ED50E|nr:ISNCY family transposase [Sphingobium sp. AP49]WHO37231.1 ISNCY family transposase [Sphingobium sp. AP49]